MSNVNVIRLLTEAVSPADPLVAVLDPLGLITPQEVSRALGGETVTYENELCFRLAYEPLRVRQDEGEKLRVSVIFRYEDILTKDVQAKAKRISLAPSAILRGLHPVVDKLISTKEDLERVYPEARSSQLPLMQRSYQETVDLVLGALLNFSLRPSLEDAVAVLWRIHFQRKQELSTSMTDELSNKLHRIPGFKADPSHVITDQQAHIQWLQELLIQSLRNTLGLGAVDKPVVNLNSETLRHLLERMEQRVDLSPVLEEGSQLEDELLLNAVANSPFPGLRKELASALAQRLLEKGKAQKHVRERKEVYIATPLETAVRYLEIVSDKELPQNAQGWLRKGVDLAEAEVLLDQLGETGNRFRARHNQWVYQINRRFARFIEHSYPNWLQKPRPPMIIDILGERVLPEVKEGQKICFIVYDGMSYDHWLLMKPLVEELLGNEPRDEPYFGVLPAATTYGRNAIFAGRFPRDIASAHSIEWLKNNLHEEELLKTQLESYAVRGYYLKGYKWEKTHFDALSKELVKKTPLVTAVSNFVDSLISAAPTGRINNVELRQFVKDRFQDSYELKLLRKAREEDYKIVITSDHGNTLVTKTASIPGVMPADKKTSRYIHLRNPVHKTSEDTLIIRQPEDWGLPTSKEIKFYALALGFLKFQAGEEKDIEFVVHGGISLQELVVPLVVIGDE